MEPRYFIVVNMQDYAEPGEIGVIEAIDTIDGLRAYRVYINDSGVRTTAFDNEIAMLSAEAFESAIESRCQVLEAWLTRLKHQRSKLQAKQ